MLPRHRILKWNDNADKLYHKMHSPPVTGFNPERYASDHAAKIKEFQEAIETAEQEIKNDEA
ncbi:MAG: hypothetical protein IJ994_07845, partial [Firmicutes bacterium]|nr:hypothetical protein [Bacillota bacterium]